MEQTPFLCLFGDVYDMSSLVQGNTTEDLKKIGGLGSAEEENHGGGYMSSDAQREAGAAALGETLTGEGFMHIRDNRLQKGLGIAGEDEAKDPSGEDPTNIPRGCYFGYTTWQIGECSFVIYRQRLDTRFIEFDPVYRGRKITGRFDIDILEVLDLRVSANAFLYS
jgi:hypothetical protein